MMCQVETSSTERKKYLDPVKDLDDYQHWVREKISDGCWVGLMGKDIVKLKERIEHPSKYQTMDKHPNQLLLWLVVIPKG